MLYVLIILIFPAFRLSITKASDHYTSTLPFFGQLGSFPPERCFFSFFVNTAAFFWLCTAYFVYATITVHVHTYMSMDLMWALMMVLFNTIGFLIGFGMALLANFQTSNLHFVHSFGFGIVLVLSLFYMWFFIVISTKLYPKLQHYGVMSMVRLSVAGLYTLSLLGK